MIGREELGRLYYIYSQRVNLGTVRGDENALWNFAPHDISVIMFLLGAAPDRRRGARPVLPAERRRGRRLPDHELRRRAMAHVHVSWLDPHKIRKLTLVGSRKMAVFDDLEANEKLRIYDKGAAGQPGLQHLRRVRGPAVRRHHDAATSRSASRCRSSAGTSSTACARASSRVSDGQDGLRVVKVLDAAQRSLKLNGEPVQARMKHYASLSLDLDNQWSYMKTHGDARLAVASVLSRRRRAAHPRLPRRAAAHDHVLHRRPGCRAREEPRGAAFDRRRRPRDRQSQLPPRALAASLHGRRARRRTCAARGERDRGRDRRAPARLPRAGLQPVGRHARDTAGAAATTTTRPCSRTC